MGFPMSDELFNNVDHTTGGGLPTILEVIESAVKAYLTERMQKREEQGQSLRHDSPQEMLDNLPLKLFRKFVVKYLTDNRVVEYFAVDANIGLVLSNQVRCVLCPGFDIAGTMQDSGAVEITSGESQPGLRGVVPSKTFGIK